MNFFLIQSKAIASKLYILHVVANYLWGGFLPSSVLVELVVPYILFGAFKT
jgi:hypothetical protein